MLITNCEFGKEYSCYGGYNSNPYHAGKRWKQVVREKIITAFQLERNLCSGLVSVSASFSFSLKETCALA